MAGTGGRRPGAGRKPTREKFVTKIGAAEKKIADKLPEIVDAMMDLALGITVEEIDLFGKPRVYRRPPDFKAGSYLMDRLMGKPVQAIEQEVSGPGGGAIPLTLVDPLEKVYGDGNGSEEP